ncbi:maleylpyruvate isomerase N-terminal domain-containing protein, partial [Nocardia cyriacigeorgica]|uniref:maleylpyruvate isomerase N-terminal domain-containing protein n=1 Tax=Nocardia cyriacigeorgica TaxID=135487 RepID=UPI0024590F7E
MVRSAVAPPKEAPSTPVPKGNCPVPDWSGEVDAPTLLPGWQRRQLVAHVAANADAVGNLV